MNPADLIVIAAVAAILGLAVWFIVRSRKKGIQCVGCPDAKTCASRGCSGKCGGGGGCGGCH